MKILQNTVIDTTFDYLTGFSRLFAPKYCINCLESLKRYEHHICSDCMPELPINHSWLQFENPVLQVIEGRIPVQRACSYLDFVKTGIVQRIIHQLKYAGNYHIGVFLGRKLGRELIQSNWLQGIDVIIPVPLHPFKEQIRGYNQSEMLARGVARVSRISLSTNNLIRTKHTETQTRKSREERWQNVQSIFELKDQRLLVDKHILLVDDVITTGATMESCASVLTSVPGSKISIAGLAFAAS